MSLMKIKLSYWQVFPAAWKFQEKTCFLAFSSFKTLHWPSTESLVCITATSASILVLSWLLFMRTLWLYCAQLDNPESSPYLRSLTYWYLQNPFCHVRQHVHRFWGLGHGSLCGVIILSTTVGNLHDQNSGDRKKHEVINWTIKWSKWIAEYILKTVASRIFSRQLWVTKCLKI